MPTIWRARRCWKRWRKSSRCHQRARRRAPKKEFPKFRDDPERPDAGDGPPDAEPSHQRTGGTSMVETETTRTNVKTLSAGEVTHLADRLFSRSQSTLFV